VVEKIVFFFVSFLNLMCLYNSISELKEKSDSIETPRTDVNTSLIFLLSPLNKILFQNKNTEKKKRKCEKVIFYVLELSYDSQIIKQTVLTKYQFV
jgi:uncharacterized membrane protein